MIIETLLDTDFYALTMNQFIWAYYPNVEVTYKFINRSNIPLLGKINITDLRSELNNVCSLQLTDEELAYINNIKIDGEHIFVSNYLQHLKNLKLPQVQIKSKDGDPDITITGNWKDISLWGTSYILSIVNELYSRNNNSFNGYNILTTKIQKLLVNQGVSFTEFGTRRRFSRKWQEEVVARLVEETPKQLIGTSNINLARKFNLQPLGTMAHEIFMVLAAINNNNAALARDTALTKWWNFYWEPLSIALTDTLGSDFFFQTDVYLSNWKGLRQDSGDPFKFTQKAIAYYKSKGIDPKTKTILFSDGLNIKSIIDIYQKLHRHINVSFGWGTDLTNDVGGYQPLSLVVKAVAANGVKTVKLSDDLNKATGTKKDVLAFQRLVGYTSDERRELRS